MTDKQVAAINTEEVLEGHERVANIVSYIIDNFDTKTMRNAYYSLKGQRVNGFNSMFAVSSIPMAKSIILNSKSNLKRKIKI